jgi:ADP-ribose pyrophosphatase YjhB (NUDIX family)
MTSGPETELSREEQFERDMRAEGEPEKEFNPGIASRIASKTVAGGAIIQDEAGRILFVTPIYKPYLEIPGGIVNANESPRAACEREIREELGLTISLGPLLVVDWIPQHGVWRDSLQFIFDGGTLSESQAASISLPHDELQDYTFMSLSTARGRLKPSLYRRLVQAAEASNDGFSRYTEFGRT